MRWNLFAFGEKNEEFNCEGDGRPSRDQFPWSKVGPDALPSGLGTRTQQVERVSRCSIVSSTSPLQSSEASTIMFPGVAVGATVLSVAATALALSLPPPLAGASFAEGDEDSSSGAGGGVTVKAWREG